MLELNTSAGRPDESLDNTREQSYAENGCPHKLKETICNKAYQEHFVKAQEEKRGSILSTLKVKSINLLVQPREDNESSEYYAQTQENPRVDDMSDENWGGFVNNRLYSSEIGRYIVPREIKIIKSDNKGKSEKNNRRSEKSKKS